MGYLRYLPLFVLSLACLAHGQAVYDGVQVQSALDNAISTGQSSYTLPPGRINLTSTLLVHKGTRNFTLLGQTGTRLVRNSSTDFPLIGVGDGGTHAYSNDAFEGASTTVSPVSEGALTVTRSSGQSLVPGWYGLIGTHPTNDVVRTYDGLTTYYYKRELVHVNAVNGNVATLDGPVGREFANGQMRLVEADSAPSDQRRVCQRIVIRNLALDGASGVDGAKSHKVLIVGLSSGVFLDDISVSNFFLSGISINMSKGVTANRIRVSQGNMNSLGYGIEISGSRFVTVRNSQFSTTRTGILFQSGAMDALIEDCTGAAVNFDVGHGAGEKRLTYRRVLGNTFTIANTTWRRGVDGVTLEDCTALSSIAVHGGASNVLIRGRYPGQEITTPSVYATSATGGNGIPNGDVYVQSLTMEDGVTVSTPTSNYNFYLNVESGSPALLGTLNIRNWVFRNLNSIVSNLQFPRGSNSPQINITNCSFQSIYEYGSPMYFGPNSGNRWNLNLNGNSFTTPGQYVVTFGSGATASWTNQDNLINGQPVTINHVENPGALQ